MKLILQILFLMTLAASNSQADTADLYAVAGNANGAVVAGTDGTVRYASGGEHSAYNPPVLVDVLALLRGAVHNGYTSYFIVGDAGTILLSSGTNGSAFQIQTSDVEDDLYAVTPFSNSIIAVGEGGRILRNGSFTGSLWSPQSSPTSATLRGVVCGPTAGVAVGDAGVIIQGSIYGLDWELVSPHPAEGTNLTAVTRLSDNRFLAIGDAGTVVRGAASGLDWTLLAPIAPVTLHGVAARATQPARVVAVGANGSIYTSTDAGDTWIDVSPGTSLTLRAVVYTDTDFIAVGDRGTILQSTEGLVWNDYTPTQPKSWGGMKARFR